MRLCAVHCSSARALRAALKLALDVCTRLRERAEFGGHHSRRAAEMAAAAAGAGADATAGAGAEGSMFADMIYNSGSATSCSKMSQ